MSATLVDTNVLLDVLGGDPAWAGWSIAQLDAAAVRGRLVINDVVYAELSVHFAAIERLDAVLDASGVAMAAMPKAALFLAGKAFKRYRVTGGTRTGVLPGFFVGAHAAVSGLTLLSRDARRYRTYFPTVSLLTP